MSQMSRLDLTIQGLYEHVFTLFDGDFHFDGMDAGKIATAVEKAARETIQRILDGEDELDPALAEADAMAEADETIRLGLIADARERQHEADEAENARRAAGID